MKKGNVKNFDISAKSADGERFGYEFRGFIKIPETGVYSFTTSSDDGSVLLIDNEMVVDNDGPHGSKKISGMVPLQAGLHEILVRYFDATGGDELRVFWSSDKIAEQQIPDGVLYHVKPK